MDVATFKARYPQFTDDLAIGYALEEAAILLPLFRIADDKMLLGMRYLTAHLLTVPQGVTEAFVTKVKAGSTEVTFSDKSFVSATNWLQLSSFGKMLELLAREKISSVGVGVFVV